VQQRGHRPSACAARADPFRRRRSAPGKRAVSPRCRCPRVRCLSPSANLDVWGANGPGV